MELEDLKSNWRILNENLGKNDVISEKAIRQLIAGKATKAQEKLINTELGGALLTIIGGISVGLLKIHNLTPLPLSTIFMLEGLLIVTALWQLGKVYFLNRTNRIDTDTADYLRQINRYARRLKAELYVTPVVMIGIVLYFYTTNAFLRNMLTVWVMVLVFLLSIVLAFYMSKNIYAKNLRKINEAVKELEEMESQQPEP